MSLIKSLIQRLLDSRTTPSEAGHSAMPSSSYITPTATAVQAWGQMAQGVAPFDGFVRASARASNTSSNIRVTNDTATVFAQSEGTATGQTQGVFVPVAKGDSWSVYGTNRDNVVVRLVKTVGGGYNILVWRALSCLRALSNFSPRNSFLAGAIGFLISPILHRLLFISRRIKQAIGIFSFRRVTAGFVLRPMPHKFCSVTGNFGKVLHRQLPLIGAFQSQFQKVGQWHTCCQKTQQTRLSSLFQASAIRVNAPAGGTSC